MNDIFETNKPVEIIDRFIIKPGHQRSLHDLMTQEYARHVQSRGLRLAGAWLTPPFARSDADSELTVVWEYPKLGAFWPARKIGRASVRERVWQNVKLSVVAVTLK